jgi:hypothetical protein
MSIRNISISIITGTGATVIQIAINLGILNGPNLRIRTFTLFQAQDYVQKWTVLPESSVLIMAVVIPRGELQKPKQVPAQDMKCPDSRGSAREYCPDTDFRAPGEAAGNLVNSRFAGSPSYTRWQIQTSERLEQGT